MKNYFQFTLLAGMALLMSACDFFNSEAIDSVTNASGPPPRELEWADLMPPGYDPMKELPDMDIGALEDGDPNAVNFALLMQEIWSEAPVVESLNDESVKIPGFMVPIEYDEKNISEFLLVPYFGACIHTPPPPANQIVYVKTGGFGPHPDMMWDPVWVTGTITAEHIKNEMGDAGYTLDAMAVAPYLFEEEQEEEVK